MVRNGLVKMLLKYQWKSIDFNVTSETIDNHQIFAPKMNNLTEMTSTVSPGGGHFRYFWVGMCRWDPNTLNLY